MRGDDVSLASASYSCRCQLHAQLSAGDNHKYSDADTVAAADASVDAAVADDSVAADEGSHGGHSVQQLDSFVVYHSPAYLPAMNDSMRRTIDSGCPTLAAMNSNCSVSCFVDATN